MAAPTDVLWLGNDGPPPPNPQTESVFHLSTAGDVLLPTLPNVSATGIAFDGTFLYFNNDGELAKRDLTGTLLADVLLSPPKAGANSEDLAYDVSTGLLWRMDNFVPDDPSDPDVPVGGAPKVTKFNPLTRVVDNTFYVAPAIALLPPGGVRWGGLGIAHDQPGNRLFLSFEAEPAPFPNGVVLVRDLTTGATDVLFQTTGFQTGGMDYDPDTQTLWIGGADFVRHISLDPAFIDPAGTTIVDLASSAILATVKNSSGRFVDGLAFVRGFCP